MLNFDLNQLTRSGLEDLMNTAATKELSRLEHLLFETDADDELRAILVAGISQIYHTGSFAGIECPTLQHEIRRTVAEFVESETVGSIQSELRKRWRAA